MSGWSTLNLHRKNRTLAGQFVCELTDDEANEWFEYASASILFRVLFCQEHRVKAILAGLTNHAMTAGFDVQIEKYVQELERLWELDIEMHKKAKEWYSLLLLRREAAKPKEN